MTFFCISWQLSDLCENKWKIGVSVQFVQNATMRSFQMTNNFVDGVIATAFGWSARIIAIWTVDGFFVLKRKIKFERNYDIEVKDIFAIMKT